MNQDFFLPDRSTDPWCSHPDRLDAEKALVAILRSGLKGPEKLILLEYVVNRRSGGAGGNYPCDVAAVEMKQLAVATGMSLKNTSKHRKSLFEVGILEHYAEPYGQERYTFRFRLDLLPPSDPPKGWRHQQRSKLTSSMSRRSRVYFLSDGRCVACSSPLKGGWHMDHIVPLARGGEDVESNLQAMCPTCNIKKGAS